MRSTTTISSDWIQMLREYEIYFCQPLDLDWSLLTSFLNLIHGPEAG